MIRDMFKSKIHRATVTDANLNYEGSITIDQNLLELANILPGEKVQVVNVNNGVRFETYALIGECGSGTICINGAAARLTQSGDLVIIITYAHYSEEELTRYQPQIIQVNEQNKPIEGEAS